MIDPPYNLHVAIDTWLKEHAHLRSCRLVLTASLFPERHAILSITGYADLVLKLPGTPGAYKDWGRLFELWLEPEVRKVAADNGFTAYRNLSKNRLRRLKPDGYYD